MLNALPRMRKDRESKAEPHYDRQPKSSRRDDPGLRLPASAAESMAERDRYAVIRWFSLDFTVLATTRQSLLMS